MASAREVSDRLSELINARDAEGIGALFAEDGVFIEPSGEFKGRQAIVEYWRVMFDAFPDVQVRDDLKADVGDSAMNEWSAGGTHSGPWETPEGSVPATGKRVTFRGCDIVAVRDGLIYEHRAYYDQLSLLTQLGLVPEGAAAL
jgi:ketosteroid isomerase-like protein